MSGLWRKRTSRTRCCLFARGAPPIRLLQGHYRLVHQAGHLKHHAGGGSTAKTVDRAGNLIGRMNLSMTSRRSMPARSARRLLAQQRHDQKEHRTARPSQPQGRSGWNASGQAQGRCRSPDRRESHRHAFLHKNVLAKPSKVHRTLTRSTYRLSVCSEHTSWRASDLVLRVLAHHLMPLDRLECAGRAVLR
jgi:hypothetical protein